MSEVGGKEGEEGKQTIHNSQVSVCTGLMLLSGYYSFNPHSTLSSMLLLSLIWNVALRTGGFKKTMTKYNDKMLQFRG